MKHAYLYDPIYHAIFNLKTHIYTMIKSLHYSLSFYFVYKITKDYLFLQVIEFLFFIYTLIVEGEESKSKSLLEIEMSTS